MNEIVSREFSVREPIVFYFKHRRRLLTAFWLPLALFVAVSFVPTPRYSASAILVVRMGSEYTYQPEVGSSQNAPSLPIPFDRDQIYKAEVAILSSDDLHADVIKEVGVEKIFPPGLLTPITGAIHGAIDGVLLRLNLLHTPNPEEAERRKLASAIMRFDKRFDILLEKESAVIDVTFENKDAGVAVEVLNKLLGLYLERRKQLYMEPRVQMAQDQGDDAQKKAALAGRAVENYKSKNKIHSLDEQRSQLLLDRSEAEKQQAALSSKALEDRVAYFNSQLDKLDTMDRELDNLQHEQQVAEEEYGLFQHKLGEAKAFEDLEHERAGGVRMIQAPSVPPEPKSLQGLIIIGGLILSLLSALATAAWTEFLSTGFVTPERLEKRVGLPVLAVLTYKTH